MQHKLRVQITWKLSVQREPRTWTIRNVHEHFPALAHQPRSKHITQIAGIQLRFLDPKRSWSDSFRSYAKQIGFNLGMTSHIAFLNSWAWITFYHLPPCLIRKKKKSFKPQTLIVVLIRENRFHMQHGFQPNFETHITFSMLVEYSVFWIKNE